jgi:hypothetical protein
VAGLIFLILGFICALIGRALLVGAAFRMSVWWGLGVFLPFGPLLFRLSYPEATARSRKFFLAALPCLFLYVVLGPGTGSTALYRYRMKRARPPTDVPPQYAMEISPLAKQRGPTIETTPNVSERRAMNAREFERLRTWNEQLRLHKRDLLRSDEEGNRAFSIDMAHYNEALETANGERAALTPPK